jgi:hypothetical protein
MTSAARFYIVTKTLLRRNDKPLAMTNFRSNFLPDTRKILEQPWNTVVCFSEPTLQQTSLSWKSADHFESRLRAALEHNK